VNPRDSFAFLDFSRISLREYDIILHEIMESNKNVSILITYTIGKGKGIVNIFTFII